VRDEQTRRSEEYSAPVKVVSKQGQDHQFLQWDYTINSIWFSYTIHMHPVKTVGTIRSGVFIIWSVALRAGETECAGEQCGDLHIWI